MPSFNLLSLTLFLFPEGLFSHREKCRTLHLFTKEIDNNLIENVIRPVALGRRNHKFAGSHEAAQRGAIVYSAFSCSKKKGIDLPRWLLEVLEKIPETKLTEVHKFIPSKEYRKIPF